MERYRITDHIQWAYHSNSIHFIDWTAHRDLSNFSFHKKKSKQNDDPVLLYSLGSYSKRWEFEIRNGVTTASSKKKSKALKMDTICTTLSCSDTQWSYLLGTNTELSFLAGRLWANGFTFLWNFVSSCMPLRFKKIYSVIVSIKATVYKEPHTQKLLLANVRSSTNGGPCFPLGCYTFY